MYRRESGLKSMAKSVWRGIDLSRRIVLNLIFLFILGFLLVALMSGGGPEVPKKAALVLAPQGVIVEQLAGDAKDRAIAKLTGNEVPETLLQDMLDAIAAAKDDDRIQALQLDLSGLLGAGFTKLQDLEAAIADFQESGKTVVASADAYTQSGYYLASLADEVYLHHMGGVMIPGFGRFRSYYKGGIDRLELDWNVFKVGEYKSAVEPYIRDSMSDEAREANLEWMGDIWNSFLQDVAAHRGLDVDQLRAYVDNFDVLIREHGGQPSDAAKSQGLVDLVGGRDVLRDRMIELVGEDEDSHSYHRIGMDTYLEALGPKRPNRNRGKGDAVAVVVAKGSIRNGSQPPGTIGGDSTASLIRKARKDDDVKAIVLRVDSGGGSAFASEVIRREFVLAREAGKKVVVSMGTVAASGGYWISTASDEIWASKDTITGSIGIFGMFPTYQKPLEKHAGVRVDGVGTSWMAGAFRPDRALDPRLGESIQAMIDQGYEDFLARVGEARDMSREEVDKIARGRVWSGEDAHELGLVDKLGTLQDAIVSAAEMAELGEEYRVKYMEKELSFTDQLMADMLAEVAEVFGPEVELRPNLMDSFLDVFRREAEMLAGLDDPNGMYAHCLCEIE